ncbi:MAG: type I DNA topoisomerase [Oscillospiraceae bacterium]|nr:type I DNA topoisomerase [Oscillospiraceae bacterium]
MNLVIVESPAKAKKIKSYLGSNYKVEASMGHLRDLPKSRIGVEIRDGFKPDYINVRGKGDLIRKLKKLAKDANKVYLATDPDREGEAISWHLSHILNLEEGKYARVAFNEITKPAIKEAISNGRKINMQLVDAQQARRILDRVVGYQISPLLWRKVKKGLSGGRVQSVATALIVRRQKEIDAFIPEEYWSIDASFAEKFEASFYGNDEKIELKSKEEVDKILAGIDSQKWMVGEVKKSEKKRNPAPPFTTSTLQQEASRKLNFQSRKTMGVAQQLYEAGLITYMRTDSLRISNEAMSSVRSFIGERYGKEFLPELPRIFKSGKNVQDAHEAIRPTDVNKLHSELGMDAAAAKLYRLIWERFVASQMEIALYDAVSAIINVGDYVFKASGQKIKFAGFMKIYTPGTDDEEKKDSYLPELREGQILRLEKISPEQHFTNPPPYYTEATLIKTLEEEGIGRPSTYAPTITTITTRGYITRDKKTLIPTELGVLVNDLMEEYFKDIVNVKFTAGIEEKLDSVAEGERKWTQVLEEFYPSFENDLKKAEEEISKIEIKDEVSDVECDLCGKLMVIKQGRFGKFLACPGFPDCKNAKPIVVEAGVNCPDCSARVLIRKTKKGRIYYSCEKNRGEGKGGCEFISWDLPTGAKCKKCSGVIIKKKMRGGNEVEVCANKECQ